MKLYLSSRGVPNAEALLRLLSGDADRLVAIIPNAWDVYPKDRRVSEIETTRKLFEGLGFTVSVVDIKNISGEALRQQLAKCSLLWVMGGNSFYLNYLVHTSGLAGFIKELLDSGLVYGGESAGAILATPTLHGVELLDDPNEAPEVIWPGLGLVDFGIVPHWDTEKYASLLRKCKSEMERHVKIKTITNDQVLVVTDGVVKLVER